VAIEARGVSKAFGRVVALDSVSLRVHAGEVVCLLGDNGAGKSTLIKILSGVHQPDEGAILVDGKEVVLHSPRDALRRGIATVYQDLAILPLMSIARNFFLGAEPSHGWGPFRRFDRARAKEISHRQMESIGIELRDTMQLAGTLLGGEGQTLAIARAEYRGAKVLILDEPTSQLGVREAAIVLRHIMGARARGLGVILITHNVNHALPVGDHFCILSHGQRSGAFDKSEVDADHLFRLMGGGQELKQLEAELAALATNDKFVPLDPHVESGSGTLPA
jgi:simple sugar transport system ATP-binding protein